MGDAKREWLQSVGLKPVADKADKSTIIGGLCPACKALWSMKGMPNIGDAVSVGGLMAATHRRLAWHNDGCQQAKPDDVVRLGKPVRCGKGAMSAAGHRDGSVSLVQTDADGNILGSVLAPERNALLELAESVGELARE